MDEPMEYEMSKPSEYYFAEAMSTDRLKWLVYNPNKTNVPFDQWLSRVKPSQIFKSEGYGWICVRSPNDNHESPDKVQLQESWEMLCGSGRPINQQSITELALSHNATVGKWLFYTQTGLKVDHLWSLVARATYEGSLGSSAKVSAFDDVNPEGDPNHVVCIYNQNFTEEEEVYDLENKIRNTGLKCQMNYKPDIYTYIGIYRNNEWSLRPSIYKSVYELNKGSIVTKM
ncbi:unnamed protein product [Owenia fusiformis]|uniref:Uncharacterized protein n=1 Tax=Owenia fusiformis TaxID=6347 RepID=A0A8J1U2V6_OWEFU|nr:unnamed protein product [Owenia fusiformis]